MNTPITEDRRSLETLATALARTATDLAAEPLPAALWQRVQVASSEASTAPALPRSRFTIATSLRAWWTAALGGLAVAAVAVVAAVVFVNLPPAVAPAFDSAGPMSGFLPLAGGDRLRALEGAPGSPAWIVPTELRRADLAALGLPFDPSRAAEAIPAEVLVQASGEVIAVRLLPVRSVR